MNIVSPKFWHDRYAPTLADWQAALLFEGEDLSTVISDAFGRISRMQSDTKGKVDASSGFCDNLTVSTGSNSAPNLILNPADNTNHARMAMSKWEVGTDQQSNGGGDFYITHPGLSSVAMTITDDGKVVPQWRCNTVNSKSAFDYVGSPIETNAYFGADRPMAASGAGIQVVSNVYNTKAIDYGYSEFSAVYTFLQGFTKYNGAECSHVNEHYIGYDNHLITPYTDNEENRPQIVMGMSYLGSLLGKGSEKVDKNGNGSFLNTMVTKPLSYQELDYYGAPSTASTQPFTALYFGGGFSGQSNIYSGDQNGAGYAAKYCFLAGNGGSGVSGTVYMDPGTRSKFQYGAYLGDWTDAGLIIGNPIGENGSDGSRQYGIYNPYCTQIGGLMPSGHTTALYVSPSQAGHDGKKVAISIGDSTASGTDGWSMGRDSGANGANDLFMFSNTAQKNMIWMDDDKIGFFGAHPAPRPTMWPVGSTATVQDCADAINRITSNLQSLGLFSII